MPIDKFSYHLILARLVLFSTTEIMVFNYCDTGLISIASFSSFLDIDSQVEQEVVCVELSYLKSKLTNLWILICFNENYFFI